MDDYPYSHPTPELAHSSDGMSIVSRSSSPDTPDFTETTSATSDWEFATSPSPAPSVYSLTDSIIAQSFRDDFGRKINNYSEVYRLPADDVEIARLQQQHRLFEDVMGRYPPGMVDILRVDHGGQKSALDLGCGCGSWIMQLARDFPHSSALGVDLVPMQSTEMPPNCSSEVDDINLGLEHFYGQFDVVNARLVSAGIKDFHGLIDHMSRVLKPGGMAAMAEWEFKIYNENQQQLFGEPTDPTFSRTAKFCTNVSHAVKLRGGNIEAPSQMAGWCLENPLFDPESIRQDDFWVPASPWCKDEGPEGDRLRAWGEGMRENSLEFFKSARPMLLRSGLSQEVTDEILENARQELVEAEVRIWIRCIRVIARRR